MAKKSLRRDENSDGNFYVDESCIDCDTCRWMVPDVFSRINGQSAVHAQPEGEAQEDAAMGALFACPTSSIGMVTKSSRLKTVSDSFPVLVSENVYHCGYHSEKSFGAASYFIQRESGNILVDSPRFAMPLVKSIERMGGVRYMYLTHQDDIADHEKFAEHFGCERILHEDEITGRTQGVEIKLKGDQPFELADDLFILPVPGHTEGHTVLIYNGKYLFSGDHLAYSINYRHLIAFRSACWYSWSELLKSMERLAGYDFEWILPGHGRRFQADKERMREEMRVCIEWMRTV